MYGRATIDALRASLHGTLLQPDDAGYEMARKVYNGMIERRPRFIVRCSNVADVIAAVKFAGKHQLLVAVRGGGHNGAGLGTCDDGLVIDLSRLKGIRVDPITCHVQYGAQIPTLHLREAVAQESQAVIRCLVAAERAVEDGRFNVAKVMRATAHTPASRLCIYNAS